MNLRVLTYRLGSAPIALVGGCIVALGVCGPAGAQVLDDQIQFLLSNNCAELNRLVGTGNGQIIGSLADNICNRPPFGSGSAAGGGSASPQASALSVQSSLIQERLERAKGRRSGETTVSARGFFRSFLGNAERNASAQSSDAGGVDRSRRFDVFGSVGYETVDRKRSAFEDGYDSSVKTGAIGFDYQFSQTVVAGLVAGYRKHDGDFSGGGDFAMDALEPSVYVSILPSPRTFLQVVAGYSSQDSDLNRDVAFVIPFDDNTTDTVSGTASSSSGGSAYSGSLLFGFDHASGRFTFGPRLGANYVRTELDAYSERGSTGLEMRIADRTVESTQGVVGLYGSWALSTRSGVVLPQFTVSYVREFEDSANIVRARFVDVDPEPASPVFTYQTNAPDSDFVNVQAGVAAVFANGIQAFVSLRTMVGNDLFDSVGGTIGVRFEL